MNLYCLYTENSKKKKKRKKEMLIINTDSIVYTCISYPMT